MKRILSIIVLLVVVVGGYYAYDVYSKIYIPNVVSDLKDPYVFIPTNSTFEEVRDKLHADGIIKDKASFEWAAKQMNYVKNPMRKGRYKIKPSMTNYDLIAHLRGAQQEPVKLAIHNKRTIEEVAGFLGTQLEADSMDFLRVFQDEHYTTSLGFNKPNVIAAIIPNTYNIYWTTTPLEFYERMVSENKKFWTADRLAKARKLNLSKNQVYTLASIVETETQNNPEKPRIAGVYLNRLRKGWKLEADPTVVFSMGDFTLKRVLKKHLQTDSPYNTYKNLGLPIGPIYMSSIASIDAVLNHETHEYMYFCAKPDLSGTHAFAKTLRQHLNNANKYHAWLNARRR